MRVILAGRAFLIGRLESVLDYCVGGDYNYADAAYEMTMAVKKNLTVSFIYYTVRIPMIKTRSEFDTLKSDMDREFNRLVTCREMVNLDKWVRLKVNESLHRMGIK